MPAAAAACRRGGRGDQFELQSAQLSDTLVGQGNGLHHAFLAGLVGTALDHGDSGFRTRHHDLQTRRVALFVGRIHHQLASHFGDANGAYRPVERYVGDRHRRRCRHHGDYIGWVLLIGGDHRGHDLDVALERLAEERPQGPVDQPRHQDLAILGRPSRLKIDPGILPAAYAFSLYSTCSGT